MCLQVADFAIIHEIHQHHGSPWFHTYSHCHYMITPQQPSGPLGVLGGCPGIAIFQPIHVGLNIAKSSLVGPYRGADVRNWEIAPGTPSLIRGFK